MTTMVRNESSLIVFDRELIEEGNYWVENLLRRGSAANLTPDYSRPAAFSPEKQTIETPFTEELVQAVSTLTRNGDFLLYTVVVAAINICLFRYTNERTTIIGSPIRKRGEGASRPT